MSHLFSRFRPLIHIPMAIGGLALFAGLAFLFGLFVMLLWNWLMPVIFGLGTITYWQAWGLVVLAHILFKSSHHGRRDHDHDHDEKWKKRFRARFEKSDRPGPEPEEGGLEQDGRPESGPEA